MKTVRKCFLALLSTASIAVAASGVQAQSLPGSQDLNSPLDVSVAQEGIPGTPGRTDSRASAFGADGNSPFNPIRQATLLTPEDERPPVVRAPQGNPPIEVQGAAYGDGLQLSQYEAMSAAGTSQAGVPAPNQTPLPVARIAPSGPPLAYMPAAGATPYPNPGFGVAPASYPATPSGFGQPPAAMGQPPAGFGQVPPGYGAPQAFPMQPQGGYPGPGMGFPQGPPQANGWASQANFAPPQPLPPGMGGMAGPAGKPGGQSFCGGCGGAGCASCGMGQGFGHGGGNGGGVMAGLLGRLLPYAEGGKCAPRWYDISMDAMYLSREQASRRVDFTADGPGPDPNIIMSTEDLDFDEKIGVRFNAAIQVLATATAEFTYFGLFSWSDSDSRSDPNGGLFSPMSQYGTFPPGGFPQTDNAIFHSIAYSSSLDNFEMNFRRRWTAPNCRVQASFLMGVRYLYLLEDFRYYTQGQDDIDPDPIVVEPGGNMEYNIRTRNSLTGFQLGADLWSSIVPGIKVGGELKAGAYGNYGNQTTVINVTEPDNTYNESVGMNDIAVIADANLMAIWRVNPNWTIRAGYSLLYIDGVGLAPEQFNSTPPNVVFPGSIARTPTANDNGSAFYHGGFAGLEWQW